MSQPPHPHIPRGVCGEAGRGGGESEHKHITEAITTEGPHLWLLPLLYVYAPPPPPTLSGDALSCMFVLILTRKITREGRENYQRECGGEGERELTTERGRESVHKHITEKITKEGGGCTNIQQRKSPEREGGGGGEHIIQKIKLPGGGGGTQPYQPRSIRLFTCRVQVPHEENSWHHQSKQVTPTHIVVSPPTV